eukprot:403346315
MGFQNFSETDVLIRIQDGLYRHQPPSKNFQPETFNKNQRLLIYDNTLDYLKERPSTMASLFTYVSTLASFHMFYFMAMPLEYWVPLAVLSGAGWLNLIASIRGIRNVIVQVHLIQHDKNPEYADQALLVLANGKQIDCKISDIAVEDHTESSIQVKIDNKNYLLVVDSEDANQYVNCELLFATLNTHTRAIMVREKKIQQQQKQKQTQNSSQRIPSSYQQTQDQKQNLDEEKLDNKQAQESSAKVEQAS